MIVEAWLAGKAVAVNSRCDATVEACRRSGGGLWFRDYGEFEVLMDRLLGDPDLRDRLAGCGATYARDLFDWDAVVTRYEALADRVLASRR